MKISEPIYRWSAICGGSGLVVMCLMITGDVIKRWLMGRPIVGIFEFSEVGLLFLIFLALGPVEHMGRQMRVDVISSRIKGRAGHLLQAVTSLLGLGFWGLILWKSSADWLVAYRMHDVRQGMIQIPSILYLGFVIYGSSLVCLSLITSGLRNVRLTFLRSNTAGQSSSHKHKLRE